MSSVLAIDPNDPTLVRGTAGDDRLIVAPGGNAIGGGGNDVFVLTAGFDGYLGAVHDFSPGDSLDVSAFGPNARLLGATSPGSQVFAIDYDGDNDADGFLFVFEDHPIPVEPDFPIGGPVPGEPAEPVRGTEGNDRLVLDVGATAIGGGGDDVFVIKAGEPVDGLLATILDYSEGDSFDVSAFGPGAKVMGMTSPGSQVIAVDLNGDDHAEAFIFVRDDQPIPVEPDFPIGGPVDSPMPVEPDFPIGGPADGEFTILPFPISGWDFWI